MLLKLTKLVEYNPTIFSDNLLIKISAENSLRALLENVLIVEKEIIGQNNEIKFSIQEEVKQSNNSFIIILNDVINLEDIKNEGIVDKAKSVLLALQN